MQIGLHDADAAHFRKTKTFPNYALMKISAYHKARGGAWSEYCRRYKCEEVKLNVMQTQFYPWSRQRAMQKGKYSLLLSRREQRARDDGS